MSSSTTTGASVYRSGTHPVAGFLLGGIGTGNITVGTRGELRDWELFNRPGAGFRLPYSFFAISAAAGGTRTSRILEARYQAPHNEQGGYAPGEMPGLPRFASAELSGAYPYARVAFSDAAFPVTVHLEAFTPFIPLRAEDSAIPAAVLRYQVRNISDGPVEVSIAGSLTNASGFTELDSMGEVLCQGTQVNEVREEGGQRGIWFGNETLDPASMHYGTMALVTSEQDVTYKPYWFQGQWTDLAEEFWRDFVEDGRLHESPEARGIRCELGERGDYGYIRRKEVVGSVAATRTLSPGEEHVFEFLLTWSFPNRLGTWLELNEQRADLLHDGDAQPKVRNHYALRYPDAWDVVRDLDSRLTELDASSAAFRDALYSSTIPTEAIEAVADNIATLRSQTCYRIADGSFFGYEGVTESYGTGAGNVTHVWNYAQTVAALFPDLEITMRDKEIRRTHDDGFMSFRELSSYQGLPWDMIACPDGQLGTIVRTLREWRSTGDREFFDRAWPAAKRSLGYIEREWWNEELGLLTGVMHNTYDIEFVGAAPMTNVMYLAALHACAALARAAGDDDGAYAARAGRVSEALREHLWTGEYLKQDRLGERERPFQFEEGCLSDQLLGQWLAQQAGLGLILPEDISRGALKSIFSFNHVADVADVPHVQRAYAMAGEAGLVNCSWPHGGRPDYPFAFSSEVWTGTEYQVAAQLVAAGMVDEAMTVVRGVRDRYDGAKRNPWAEIEAGWHYTRGMASWSLLTAYSGVVCSVPERSIRFDPPHAPDQFATFFSCGAGWGVYAETREAGRRRWRLDVRAGDLDGFAVNGTTIVASGVAEGEEVVS